MLKWLGILWPAFLTAGMLEIVVFAFVDPANVQPVAGVVLSRTALYSVAFLVFWALVSCSSAVSMWLSKAPSESPMTAV